MNPDKIIASIEKITEDVGSAEEVAEGDNEFYFKFKGHTFSIAKLSNGDGFRFYVYPRWKGSAARLQEVYNDSGDYWDDSTNTVLFGQDELGADGNLVMARLYKALESKAYGLDGIWKSILEDDDIPF